MTERDDAIKLANRILDKPNIDPDGDICLLARQFLREVEQLDYLRRTIWICSRFARREVGITADIDDRLIRLERDSHPPVDFSELFARVDRLERKIK